MKEMTLNLPKLLQIPTLREVSVMCKDTLLFLGSTILGRPMPPDIYLDIILQEALDPMNEMALRGAGLSVNSYTHRICFGRQCLPQDGLLLEDAQLRIAVKNVSSLVYAGQKMGWYSSFLAALDSKGDS